MEVPHQGAAHPSTFATFAELPRFVRMIGSMGPSWRPEEDMQVEHNICAASEPGMCTEYARIELLVGRSTDVNR